MKKVKLMFVSLLTVIISLFCLVGCGTAGTYKFYKLETSIGSWEVGENFMGTTLTEDFMTLVLNSDNTFSLTEKEDGETDDTVGTWAEEDGKVTLSVDGEAIMTGTLDGNTITFEVMGQKTILKK